MTDPGNQQNLIDHCLRGDRVAQYRLYRLYVQPMYNLCMRMVADRMTAEDLLQEAFIKVFRQLHTYRGEASVGAWIKRIVVNQCLNHLRQQRPAPVIPGWPDLEDIPEPWPEKADIPPEKIQEAIRELPEGARVVLVLHLLEGYRHRDIAQMLNISESTSKSQYQRARTLLQGKLTEQYHEQQV